MAKRMYWIYIIVSINKTPPILLIGGVSFGKATCGCVPVVSLLVYLHLRPGGLGRNPRIIFLENIGN